MSANNSSRSGFSDLLFIVARMLLSWCGTVQRCNYIAHFVVMKVPSMLSVCKETASQVPAVTGR